MIAEKEQLIFNKLTNAMKIFKKFSQKTTGHYFDLLVTQITFPPEKALEHENYLQILRTEKVKIECSIKIGVPRERT